LPIADPNAHIPHPFMLQSDFRVLHCEIIMPLRGFFQPQNDIPILQRDILMRTCHSFMLHCGIPVPQYDLFMPPGHFSVAQNDSVPLLSDPVQGM